MKKKQCLSGLLSSVWLLVVSGTLNCSGRQPGSDPAGVLDGTKTPGGPTPAGGNNDVASGGQSGGSSGGHPGPACYCQFGPVARARLVNAGDSGACAVFELLQHPDVTEGDFYDLQVGDHFGGRAQLLCDQPFDVNEGEEVYVSYRPGGTSDNECPEYLACSSDQCGDPSQLDALPSDEYEQRAAEYDRCITACQENTRDQCAARADESRFSGRVRVARIDDEDHVVFVNGETYHVPAPELLEQDCHPTGVPERQIVPDVVINGEAGSGAADAPPPPPSPDTLVCPVP